MKEEKNLDRLFQEKFKDFERHPSDAVWNNIIVAKDEKEDRKVVPLWWRLAGAAAIIAILFTTGVMLFSDANGNAIENEIVTTPTQEDPILTEIIPSVIENNNPLLDNNGDDLVAQKEEATSNPSIKQDNQNSNTIVKTSSSLASTTTSSKTISNKLTLIATTNTDTKGIAINENSSSKNTFKEVLKTPLEPNAVVSTASHNLSEDAKDDLEKISLIDEAKRIADEKNEEEAVALLDEPAANPKWNVGAVAAPVYFGDFGGSGLDPAFSDNTKSGDVNFSYGVQVSYNLSPKLKVRTGVSNVDLSYNTNGISFTPNTNARRIPGINYSQNAQALNITDRSSVQSLDPRDGIIENELSNTTNGSLQQRIGFVEIPLEAVYTLSNKRLGIQVVGGLSTLLLNNNEVLLNSEDGLQSNLGTANGLNDVSFTTNIGLGLNYKMTEKINLNVEPSLKYQLNAFDESVGDFKPYYVGIYTGVNYRF